MPKSDNQKVINGRSNGKMHASIGGAIYSSDGMADTLDGYDASKQPGANLIPVSLADGKIDSGWLPEQSSSGAGASATGGQVYVAPWVRLARAISETDTTIYLNGAIHAVGDRAVLGHYQYGNENIAITGGPTQQGTIYEYTITRGSPARPYPAGSTVVFNLGGESDGGYITIVSGDQQQSLVGPHINMYGYTDGTAVRKVRLGLLSGLSAGEKALFPTVTDWNRYSLFADDAFLRGQIIATSGNLSGNLDVGGTLRVRSGIGEAGVVVGTVEGGYGINLLNEQGRPTFAAVSPYEDSDVAVYFDDGHGEKDFYFHKVDDRYKLEIKVDTLIDGTLEANNILIGTGTYPGAFVGLHLGKETGFTGYGTDFAKQVAWDARDGKLSFGGQLIGGWEGWLGRNGMTIDARQYDSAKPLFEHAIRWLHPSNYAGAPNEFIGANIGSDRGRWWAGARRYISDVTGIAQPPGQENEMYQAALILSAGGASTFSGQAVNIIADSYLAVWPGNGSASFFRAERVEMPAVDIANGLIFTNITDQGSFVGIGTATPNGARLIAEADSIAQIRAQRSGGTAYAAVTVTAADEAWISASGSIVLAPHAGFSAPNYVLPPSATRKVSIGSLARPFEEVYARHGHFGTLGSQSALTGSMYLTRSAPALAANLEADNVLAYYEDANLLPGAYIRYEDTETHAVEVLAITSTGRAAMVEEQEAWEYDVFRAAEGTAQLWYAGTVGVHLGGNNTDGYVRMVGLDDNNAAIGPAMVVFQRDNGEASANVSERAAFGNLNTFYHYTDPIYGFAAGRKEGSWVSVDEFDGFRVMFGETQLARYREAIDLGDEDGSHIHIDPDDVTLYAGATPVIELFGTGDANITGTLAVATGGAITWAGGKGVADDTGLRVTDDANNYAQFFKQPAQYLYVVVDGSSSSTAISGLSTANTGVRGVGGVYGVVGDSTSGRGVYGYTTAGHGVYAEASTGGVALAAVATGGATTALQISGGIVDGGSQRYTALADATADTDALNRQTADARYLGASAGLLATGATTGATSQAQTFTNGIVGPSWKPAADGTTALQIQQAGGTAVVTVDTTNKRVGIGGTPSHQFEIVNGSASQHAIKITAAAAQSAYSILLNKNDGTALFGVDELGRFRIGSASTHPNKFLVTGSDSISNSVTDAYAYIRNTLASGSGHAGIMLDRGAEGAVASFGFLTAGVNSFEIGDYNNHLFLRDIKGTYVFFARWAHGIPADTIYGASTYTRFNDGGNDYDWIIEGDTATELLRMDAGLDAVQIGTTTAGVIADFRSSGIVLNEDGADRDIRFEGDTDANNFFSDASTDRIGIGTNAPSAKLDINSDVLRLRTAKTPATAGAAGNAGDICWDSGFLYVCTATNTWVRAALATW